MNSQLSASNTLPAYQPTQRASSLPQSTGFADVQGSESQPIKVDSHPAYALTKRVVDIVAALTLTAVLSPVMLLVTLALKREAGVALVRHTRVGKDGREFKVLKYRTLRPDASGALREFMIREPQKYQAWIQDRNLESDPRLTRTGKFLRKTNLDQLPKLWNVLKGDMSLVGPRPITREELRKYGGAARYYLAHRPGLTGFWQTAGGVSRDYRRRIAVDKLYALSASLWVDLLVLFSSTSMVLSRPLTAVSFDKDDEISGEFRSVQ